VTGGDKFCRRRSKLTTLKDFKKGSVMADLILMANPAGKNEKVRREDVEYYLRLGYKHVEQTAPAKELEAETTKKDNNEEIKESEESEEGEEII